MHTIIPGMLREDGQVTMPFGVMGGAYQPNGHARVVTNLVDYGMDPQEALDGPRSFPDAGELAAGTRLCPGGPGGAGGRVGHRVEFRPRSDRRRPGDPSSTSGGVLIGGSDPRKDGCAIGY